MTSETSFGSTPARRIASTIATSPSLCAARLASPPLKAPTGGAGGAGDDDVGHAKSPGGRATGGRGRAFHGLCGPGPGDVKADAGQSPARTAGRLMRIAPAATPRSAARRFPAPAADAIMPIWPKGGRNTVGFGDCRGQRLGRASAARCGRGSAGRRAPGRTAFPDAPPVPPPSRHRGRDRCRGTMIRAHSSAASRASGTPSLIQSSSATNSRAAAPSGS